MILRVSHTPKIVCSDVSRAVSARVLGQQLQKGVYTNASMAIHLLKTAHIAGYWCHIMFVDQDTLSITSCYRVVLLWV